MYAQKVEPVKISYLSNLLSGKSDTTYVLNFWATWCKPCVKELPAFEKFNADYANKKVKIILVSLDFINQINSRLVPFIEENKIRSTVVLLDEPDYNSWIDKVNKTWSGTIPATLVINNNKKKSNFYEQEITYQQLEKIIKPYLN